jgi:hypothetical protein
MRLQNFAFLGLISIALASACGNNVETGQSSGTAGAGGEHTTTSATTGTEATTATSSVSTSSSSSGSTMYPAPHPPPPQVISGGGPVLASPRIVPIFFSNDDPTEEGQIQDFVAQVGATSYWTAAVSEYGVGPATAVPPVELAETATGMLTDADVQNWLAAKLNADLLPAPDANTVYVIHYPSGVTIVEQDPALGGTIESCQTFGGYHESITLDANHDGMPVAFAVIPRCQSFGDLLGIDAITGAESHELVEASTDPYPETTPAWVETDELHLYWDLAVGGGEVGDMCAQDPEAFTKFAGFPYTVQRIWSNKAALAGQDPCVPALPGEVYFNAAPVMNDTLDLSIEGQSIDLTGVSIPVGGTKTIAVDLFSDGPTGPFEVEAQDYNALMGMPANLDLSLDNSVGVNGQTLNLTINVKSSGQYGVELFFLIVTQGQTSHFWVGDVGN